MKFVASLVSRLMLPIGILALGVYGFMALSVTAEDEPSEPRKPKVLRSRVSALHPISYPVKIETSGVVGPHNQVTLSAEVTGKVETIKQAFEVGSFFSAGDLLIELDSADYETALRVARENNALAKATAKLAESAHDRMKELSRRNSASVAEQDLTYATLVQSRSQVQITAAAIDQAERDLQRTKIYAPFDGRVVSKLVGVGQLVSPGSVLGDVFAVDFAEVRLPISGRDLRYLRLPEREGDPTVEVELRDAIDPTSQSRWTAKIVRTEGTLDAASLELFVVARIDDPFATHSDHDILRIGQPVAATIQGEMLDNVIAIPRTAVRRMDKVFLIDKESKKLRSLTIDPLWSDQDYVIVRNPEIRDRDLLSTTILVYAPEGSVVEIIPDIDGTQPNLLKSKGDSALAGQPAAVEATP